MTHVRRFDRRQRTLHLVVMTTFLGLTATGIPLLFSEAGWARVLATMFGGFRSAGMAHRVLGVTLLGALVWHLGTIAWRAFVRGEKGIFWGPASMVPQPRDFVDLYRQVKWFFGLGPRPHFEQFTYWEKFDYWAPFWGVTIIGVSGLVMWLPSFFGSFLPGWVFNVASIFHGEEAFLAVVFLFTVHFFNNHFRPDKLPPPDVVMFTGSVPLEEFKREHAAQYERLVANGELEKYLVDAPSRQMHIGSVILGVVLITFGLTLLVLVSTGFFSTL